MSALVTHGIAKTDYITFTRNIIRIRHFNIQRPNAFSIIKNNSTMYSTATQCYILTNFSPNQSCKSLSKHSPTISTISWTHSCRFLLLVLLWRIKVIRLTWKQASDWLLKAGNIFAVQLESSKSEIYLDKF